MKPAKYWKYVVRVDFIDGTTEEQYHSEQYDIVLPDDGMQDQAEAKARELAEADTYYDPRVNPSLRIEVTSVEEEPHQRVHLGVELHIEVDIPADADPETAVMGIVCEADYSFKDTTGFAYGMDTDIMWHDITKIEQP